MGRRFINVLALAIVIGSGATVKAETSSDLYKLYGVEDSTKLAQLKSELAGLEKEYSDLDISLRETDIYNIGLSQLLSEENKSEYAKTYNNLQNSYEELLNSAYDLSYEEIQKKDANIRSQYSTLRKLYTSFNKYVSYSVKDVSSEELLKLNNSINETTALINQEISYSDIGDVTDIINFVQSSFVVKTEFDNTGASLSTKEDTGVLSLFSGTVTQCGKTKDKGQVIEITSPDSIVVTYYNVKSRYVQEGDVVSQYQKIATTNANLYFTLSINNNYFDPLKLYRR